MSERALSWEHLSDRDLLKARICDLGVTIEGSELPGRIEQLHQELEASGLRLRPVCYLADEWFTPDRTTSIAIPFYLAHPRLKALEFRMMLEVEGGTHNWCLRLLRHEAGHALDHAFGLSRAAGWRQTFGSPRAPYTPEQYLADPHSQAHVRNLPDNYAQCHPEEDFAETFAVWLNPSSQWRTRYRGWPAMRKLRYVDRVARALAGRLPPSRRRTFPSAARNLHSTLESYYQRKFRMYRLDDLDFTLPVMRGIFRRGRARTPADRAAAFIRAHKRRMVESIAAWTGERGAQVGKVVAGLARLAEEHSLVRRDDPDTTLVRVATYIATLVSNRLHTHTYRLRRP